MYKLNATEQVRLNYYLNTIKSNSLLYQEYRFQIDNVDSSAKLGILSETELYNLMDALSELERIQKNHQIHHSEDGSTQEMSVDLEFLQQCRTNTNNYKLAELRKQGLLAFLEYITPDCPCVRLQQSNSIQREI